MINVNILFFILFVIIRLIDLLEYAKKNAYRYKNNNRSNYANAELITPFESTENAMLRLN